MPRSKDVKSRFLTAHVTKSASIKLQCQQTPALFSLGILFVLFLETQTHYFLFISSSETLVVEPIEELGGEVADDNGGTSSKNALCRFKSHGLEIKHSGLGSSVNHGELATDLVSSDGQVLAKVLGVTNNVQVLASRLNHDDVGTLVHVADNGSASKATASRRQLVAPAVAK